MGQVKWQIARGHIWFNMPQLSQTARPTFTRPHTHWSLGCRQSKELPGCSTMKVPDKARTKTKMRASRDAITFDSSTHGSSRLSNGSRKLRKVVGREIETHVEHLIPCQLMKPSSLPRSTDTIWVLTRIVSGSCSFLISDQNTITECI